MKILKDPKLIEILNGIEANMLIMSPVEIKLEDIKISKVDTISSKCKNEK